LHNKRGDWIQTQGVFTFQHPHPFVLLSNHFWQFFKRLKNVAHRNVNSGEKRKNQNTVFLKGELWTESKSSSFSFPVKGSSQRGGDLNS
jgi:hypothetical protein